MDLSKLIAHLKDNHKISPEEMEQGIRLLEHLYINEHFGNQIHAIHKYENGLYKLEEISPSVERLLGYKEFELLDPEFDFSTIIPKNEHNNLEKFVERFMDPFLTENIEIFSLKPKCNCNSEFYMVKVHVTRDSKGKPISVSSFANKVTDLVKEKEMYKRLSKTDALTNLNNISGFEERVIEEISYINRSPSVAGILYYIDLNDFKEINDKYGHDAGNFVLEETAKRMMADIRAYDIVGRLGGDELGLWCRAEKENDLPEFAKMKSNHLKSIIRRDMDYEGTIINLEISVGSIIVDYDRVKSNNSNKHKHYSDLFRTIIQEADDKMYEDKQIYRKNKANKEFIKKSQTI